MLKLTVAYDGAAFAGSQRQGEQRTVQSELERAVATLIGHPVPVYLAGRTDASVHAAGQVASLVDERPRMSGETVRDALNALLEDDLAVLQVERRPFGFHARYDARWREYRYRFWTGVKQPLAVRTVWQIRQRPSALNLEAMNAGARLLIGTHDVASFAGGGEGVPGAARQAQKRGTVRSILLCEVRELTPWWGATKTDEHLYELRVAADGFLPKMVRAITGAIVEIGREHRPAGWIGELIEAKDRRRGPMTAPPHGLTLWRVGYDDELPEPMETLDTIGAAARPG